MTQSKLSAPKERDATDRPGLESWGPLVCALLAATAAGALIVGSRDFALDDAWIHLSYAKSLRLGDGLSYNPGDWETGCSSPLWAVLLSGWPIAGNPVVPVKLLGALLHALTAWAGAELALELGRTRATLARPLPLLSITLLGGTLVALTPTLLLASISGMEVPLAASLGLLGMRAAVRNKIVASLLLGALAVLARPENLFLCMAFGLPLALWRYRQHKAQWQAPVVLAGSAAAGLLGWVGYNLAVSGFPWPNTQYIKGDGGGLAGLTYLSQEVLPWQPWLVSLAGLALLIYAVRSELSQRRPEVVLALAAFTITLIAIAISRPLHPGVQFYERRYFTIVAAIPMALLPLGVVAVAGRVQDQTLPPRWRRWVAAGLLLAVAGLSGLQIKQLHAAFSDASEDTRVLHREVARYIAEQLPADAVVGVEGAGATRFFAPRSMTIVDLVGLNAGTAAHLHHDRVGKLCHFIDRKLTHLAIPAAWGPQFSPPFKLGVLARFDDTEYTQILPPSPASVIVFEVGGVHPKWRERCAARARDAQ